VSGPPPPTDISVVPGGPLIGADLDRLIRASWVEAKVTPSPAAEDGEFLRRVSLDLVGRVPTLEEARAFWADGDRKKRIRLVDRLLASPDFAEHWADVYGELLWGFEGNRKIDRGQADPRAWLVTAFTENWGYDRLTWEILTASGDLRSSGAPAFIAARARGMGGPEAVAGATARIFLGLQIQCAQCHDHPYDARWKQEDFYGLAAYFSRTKARQDRSMEGKTFVVFDQRRGQARMRKPRTEKDVVVEPSFLGRRPVTPPDETLRQTLGRAVLGSDLFPKAMVARTWKQLFGRGLVEPWDDLGAEHDAGHPLLLVRLAEDFRLSGFDIKRLLRRIVLSTAYARSSAPPPGAADDGGAAVRAFARAGVRPLRPEQLFRTLLAATAADQMARRRRGEAAVERLMTQTLREYKFAFDDDEMLETDNFDGSVPQALLLLNGELTNRGARSGQAGVLGEILRRTRDPQSRLDDMYLAVYTRLPRPEERAFLLEHLRQAEDRRAYEDIYFALLTSTEAITNH
jgi:hypothetical protein